jgi:hypothetical protein
MRMCTVMKRPASVERRTPIDPAVAAPDPLVIVTGLPRSGTSLLMAMLKAGGIATVTDGLRQPDEDNPRGYFEDARVKSLARDASWLSQAAGCAVKILIPLIRSVPATISASILWVHRDMEEVLNSQAAMLQRQAAAPAMDRALLAAAFQRQTAETRSHLAAIRSFRVKELAHRSLIHNPAATAAEIAQFLAVPVDSGAMASCVDPSLYRQRRTAEPAPES